MVEMHEKEHRILKYTLEMLDRIADTTNPLEIKEILDMFPLSRSTVYNLLQTLVNMGYLEKDSGGHYSIGIRCFRTGNAFRASNPFINKARDIVERVNKICKETTHFALLEGTDVIYLYKFDSAHAIRIHSEIGKKIPAHTTAIGKAMLSCYSDEDIEALYPNGKLPSQTPKSITSIKVLIGQLREVRRTSIAYEQEESTPYVKCIAVAIVNAQNFPVAGLSIAMPIYRDEKDINKMIPLLLDAKKELEDLNALYTYFLL
jgi:DNA-binding IclR family transcriptional regulator